MLHDIIRSLIAEGTDPRSEMLAQLPGHQRDMVDGILEIVLMVDDLDNRRQIVDAMIRKFRTEGILFKHDLFVQSCGC
jgi:hypothetical protein